MSPESSTENVVPANDSDCPLDLPIFHDEENREEPKETQELVAKGNVSKSLYWKYFRASGSYCLLFIVLITYIISQLLISGSDYWVAFW